MFLTKSFFFYAITVVSQKTDNRFNTQSKTVFIRIVVISRTILSFSICLCLSLHSLPITHSIHANVMFPFGVVVFFLLFVLFFFILQLSNVELYLLHLSFERKNEIKKKEPMRPNNRVSASHIGNEQERKKKLKPFKHIIYTHSQKPNDLQTT